MVKHVITEKHKAIIVSMCDLMLRSTGIKNLGEVNSVITMLAEPIKEDNKEEQEEWLTQHNPK